MPKISNKLLMRLVRQENVERMLLSQKGLRSVVKDTRDIVGSHIVIIKNDYGARVYNELIESAYKMCDQSCELIQGEARKYPYYALFIEVIACGCGWYYPLRLFSSDEWRGALKSELEAEDFRCFRAYLEAMFDRYRTYRV